MKGGKRLVILITTYLWLLCERCEKFMVMLYGCCIQATSNVKKKSLLMWKQILVVLMNHENCCWMTPKALDLLCNNHCCSSACSWGHELTLGIVINVPWKSVDLCCPEISVTCYSHELHNDCTERHLISFEWHWFTEFRLPSTLYLFTGTTQ